MGEGDGLKVVLEIRVRDELLINGKSRTCLRWGHRVWFTLHGIWVEKVVEGFHPSCVSIPMHFQMRCAPCLVCSGSNGQKSPCSGRRLDWSRYSVEAGEQHRRESGVRAKPVGTGRDLSAIA